MEIAVLVNSLPHGDIFIADQRGIFPPQLREQDPILVVLSGRRNGSSKNELHPLDLSSAPAQWARTFQDRPGNWYESGRGLGTLEERLAKFLAPNGHRIHSAQEILTDIKRKVSFRNLLNERGLPMQSLKRVSQKFANAHCRRISDMHITIKM